MMQDRFKGADLFPAMAIYVLGWPLGIAAAQAVLPGLSVAFGWQVPFLAGAAEAWADAMERDHGRYVADVFA